jgi:hypothetical protein
MRAIIYDNQDKGWIETKYGTIIGSDFTYYEHDIPYIKGMLGTKTIQCDMAHTKIGDGGVKTAEYDFDGKDYIQRKYTTTTGDKPISVADYLQTARIAEMAKDEAIKKPDNNMQQIATFLAIIAVLIAAAGVYISSGNLNAAVQPMNNVTNQNAALINTQHNQTALMLNICNQTLRYMQIHNP